MKNLAAMFIAFFCVHTPGHLLDSITWQLTNSDRNTPAAQDFSETIFDLLVLFVCYLCLKVHVPAQKTLLRRQIRWYSLKWQILTQLEMTDDGRLIS